MTFADSSGSFQELLNMDKPPSMSFFSNTAPSRNPQMEPQGASYPPILRLHALILILLSLLAVGFYSYAFFEKISPFWFSPRWTTDDALQQTFPFFDVLDPDLFKGDLIHDAMKGYLAPIHYGLGYVITKFTHNPIMTGHYLMAVQFGLSFLFLFLTVRAACLVGVDEKSYGAGILKLLAIIPSLGAVVWSLHSRALVQRMTGGLPRGWAPAIFLATLFCTISGKNRLAILSLFAGALLNPPATFLAAVAHGITVLLRLFATEGRARNFRPLVELILVAPLLALLTVAVTQRPPEIGALVNYDEALSMPEFQKAGGRFAFVPFFPAEKELRDYPFRSMMGKLYRTPNEVKRIIPIVVVSIVVALVFAGLLLKREVLPYPLLIFGVSALAVYFLSRAVAFRLYVPDRHLTFPVGLFLIGGMTSGVWRLFVNPIAKTRTVVSVYGGAIALMLLASLVYWGSGNGLQEGRKGTLNFNYNDHSRGRVMNWIKVALPKNALVAGHPTFIDPIQLFGERKGFVTSETWHPFYKAYNEEMKRRLDITFRALYARDLPEFLSLVKKEGITHFIFSRGDLSEAGLKRAYYHRPFDTLVKELASRPVTEYAFRELPRANKSVVPFIDDQSLVVDIAELDKWVEGQKVLSSGDVIRSN